MGHHLKLEPLTGGLAILTFDTPGQKVNTFSAAVLQEFTEVAAELAKRTDLRGLLFTSGKAGQFIAGADLTEVSASPEGTMETIGRGHQLFTAFSQLPFPTVALINGACMGGGTELVLAFDYRLAVDGPQTKIGLPEVKIGLIPGWGGTQRLPRVVGIDAAIEMITSGEPVDARKAIDIGLIYDAVPVEKLIAEATYLIDEAHRTGEWTALRQRRNQPLGLSEDQFNFAFGVAEGAVKGKTRGQYPAPLVALKAIRDGINRPLEEGLVIEQAAFREVGSTTIAANLIAQFFNNTRLARESGVDDRTVQPRSIQNVGVLGAGLMGAGIATACARRGVRATMVDVDAARVELGMKNARRVVEDRIAIHRATSSDLADMLSRLTATTSRQSFSECDLVVEAVTENEKLKTQIIEECAKVVRPDALFASNTSTISITRLAKAWPQPESFAGLHFFSPVDRMQLVEVVRGEKTSDEAVVSLVALAKKIGKTPIVVRDCPGFLVNRILMPYMAEALVLLEEGVDMDRIDKIATKWGMPVGPITLYDMVGIDTGLYAGQVLQAGYADRAVATPILAQLVELGRLGKKSGKGFRGVDKKGKFVADPEVQQLIAHRVTKKSELSDDDVADRLFLCMALEAIRALSDKIARQPGDIDMAMILGVNFPAFRGGPLRWCDTEGAAKIAERSKKWESLGHRFDVPAALAEAAKNGTHFYPKSPK
ncbi:3-hydroxyacyl-CoA dehydrogenase NAD-binding domain-containing protein [Schlesneria paludicola]|uniref:3-hydroxyacyl-CoA dehydrogenase NAD-binding domain-containing protein n=1 Tax=Schlesneria paludicola TaxID=360056 RepID=UPI00029ACE18|nr:3-hydroxyacyl-CoA dehydrogenase NAD-binding domain-containing protein [Schlesneria paludicola]